MLTLFPRIRPNPLPPAAPEPPAASGAKEAEPPQTASQTFDSLSVAPSLAVETEAPVAAAIEGVVSDAPGIAATPAETASANLTTEGVAESGPAVAQSECESATVQDASPGFAAASSEDPFPALDVRPPGLPFAAANIFDEIEILHETSVELRSAFVIEIPHLQVETAHVTLEEVVQATNDANAATPEPSADTAADPAPADATPALTPSQEGAVLAPEPEWGDEIATPVVPQGDFTGTAEAAAAVEATSPFEAGGTVAPEEVASPEEVVGPAEVVGIEASERDAAPLAATEDAALVAAPLTQAEEHVEAAQPSPAEAVEFSDEEVAGIVTPEPAPPALPFEAAESADEAPIPTAASEEPSAQTSSDQLAESPPEMNAIDSVADAPVTPALTMEASAAPAAATLDDAPATNPAETIAPADLSTEVPDNAPAQDALPTATTIATTIEAVRESVDAQTLEQPPVTDIPEAIAAMAEPAIETSAGAAEVAPPPIAPATEPMGDAAAEIRAHFASLDTVTLPGPIPAKAKRPKGIGFFESVRVPEEESMDDSDEVEAYASAAAQAHLDAIDDTFVAHAQLLIKGRERGRALDIGTGPGQIVLKLGSQLTRWKFVGVDRSAAMLEKARESLANTPEVAGRVEFRLADGNSLDLPDATFDLVICNSVLHHMAEPQKLFAEMARMVKPGGAILLRDLRRPSRFEFGSHVKKHGKHYDGEMKRLYINSLHAAYTEEELQKMLAASALRGVRVFTHGKTHIGFECAIAAAGFHFLPAMNPLESRCHVQPAAKAGR